MGAHRELAISAMEIMTEKSIAAPDFMAAAGLKMPGVTIPGAIPATLRTQVSATDLKLPAELVLVWTIGDYPLGKEHSTYYDPKSPWYNVFFGGYAIRSYKLDGSAWGYEANGNPDFEEFLKVPAIDYNFFTAGQFGCPPEKMSFEVTKLVATRTGGWDCAQVAAYVPSGLHEAVWSLGDPGSYVVYGIPGSELLEGHQPYERLSMQGQMFMRRIPQGRIDPKIPQPITFAFGALCQDTSDGQDLLVDIMKELKAAYMPLFG